jgi:site-specific DNA recombinase
VQDSLDERTSARPAAPRAVYIRESAIVPKLDAWIAQHFDQANPDETCEALWKVGEPDETTAARVEAQRKIADCDRRLARYRATLDAGGDPAIIAGEDDGVKGERLKTEREASHA